MTTKERVAPLGVCPCCEESVPLREVGFERYAVTRHKPGPRGWAASTYGEGAYYCAGSFHPPLRA